MPPEHATADQPRARPPKGAVPPNVTRGTMRLAKDGKVPPSGMDLARVPASGGQQFRIVGSIIGFHHLRSFREEMTGDVLHVRLFPEGELIVGLQVLQWNWMSPHYHRQAELFFDKSLELLDIRARRITDHQARRQVYNVRSVL